MTIVSPSRSQPSSSARRDSISLSESSSTAPSLRSHAATTGWPAWQACHSRDMRIASLVPSATEALFALGLGDQVVAVTHECDHPAEVRGFPA